MSGYIDVEGMRSAASRMCSAAEDMKNAASWHNDYIQQHIAGLREHADAMRAIQDKELQILTLRTELEQMIAHDAGIEGQGGRYAESAYDDLRKRMEATR